MITRALRAANQWALRIVLVALWAWSVLFVAMVPKNAPAEVLLAIGFYVFGGFLVTLVHEIGHAFAATLTGWRVIAIAVGPATLAFYPVRLGPSAAVLGPDLGGAVFCAPARAEFETPARNALISLSGALANLAVGLALLGVGLILHPAAQPPISAAGFVVANGGLQPTAALLQLPKADLFLAHLAIALALQNAMGVVGALWPTPPPPGTGNDGWHIIDALRNRHRMSPAAWARAHLEFGVVQDRWPLWLQREGDAETKLLDALLRGDQPRVETSLAELRTQAPGHALAAYLAAAHAAQSSVAAADDLMASIGDLAEQSIETLWVRDLALIVTMLHADAIADAHHRADVLTASIRARAPFALWRWSALIERALVDRRLG